MCAGKIHALMATARVANVPSVVSNVWVGGALGMSFWWGLDQNRFPEIMMLMASAVCLYVYGNFLNDWKDAEWDVKHRPERALPSGMFQKGTYLGVACVLAVMGFISAWVVNGTAGAVALAIILCVVIYTVWHKERAWTVLFMGLCRGLLPVLGACVVKPSLDLAGVCGAALCCYITGLSLSARAEARGEIGMGTRWVSRGLWVLAAGLMLWPHWRHAEMTWLLGVAPLVYGCWIVLCSTFFRVPVARHVSGLLAGIPLLDWVFLLPLLAMPGPVEIASAVIPPLAFVSALLLQRLAPAT